MAGIDFGRLALVFGGLAFQLMITTMAMGIFRLGRTPKELKDKDDATQALLIIGYILLMSTFVLLLLQNFSDVTSHKIARIVTLIALLVAALFIIAGTALYADEIGKVPFEKYQQRDGFSLTTNFTAAGAAVASAVFLLLQMCCK